MRTRSVAAAVAAVLAGLLAQPGAAAPGDPTVLTAGFTYLPGSLEVPRGTTPYLLNLDPVPHNVVARVSTKKGPLFRSDLAGPGQEVPVVGVDRLRPGFYAFFCTVHEQMAGELVVTG